MKHPDLTGQRIGRWTVLELSDTRYKAGERMYLCRCDCGNTKHVRPASLHDGSSKSCGCLRAEIKSGQSFIGKRFGKLVVIGREPNPTQSRAYLYVCHCDCGKERRIRIGQLTSGKTQSCGCLRNRKRVPEGQSAVINLMLAGYRNSAKQRKLSFELSKEQFVKIASQSCYYCGAAPTYTLSRFANVSPLVNGIDRMDNSKGYTLDNCVPCCTRCNFAKKSMNSDQFILMANQIAARHQVEIVIATQA